MLSFAKSWFATSVCAFALPALALAVAATEITIVDAKSQPESLSVAPNGTLYAGSAASPYVYKVRPGSQTAEKFVDASAEGADTFFLGVLVDAAHDTLWTCQLAPVAATKPVKHRTALRGFRLSTGVQTLRWTLPGADSICNDFSVGPDQALYITDTANARIYKLPVGAQGAQLFLEDPALSGVDGITFLNGTLYVNNVRTNKLYRIPVNASGKAGQPVEIALDQPVKGPDGMRAAHGKLLLAENAAGQIDAIAVEGDKAHVTVIKEGLKTPTAVEPAGEQIWVAERGTGKAVPVPMIQ